MAFGTPYWAGEQMTQMRQCMQESERLLLIVCLKSFVTSSQKQAGIERMLLSEAANRSRSSYPQNNPRYYRKLIEYFSEALPKTNRHITLF